MPLDAASEPLVPPAPAPPGRPLRGLKLIEAMRTSMLSIWGPRAYDLKIISGKVFGRVSILVNDPAAVRRVTTDNVWNYVKHVSVSRLTRPVVGEGLLLSEGQEWRRQRRVLSPAFTPAHVELLAPHFAEAARGLIKAVEGRPRVNLASALQEATLDAAARSMFSMPIGGRGQKLAELARGYFLGAGRPSLFDALAVREEDYWLFSPGRRRFRRQWSREMDAIIEARRAKGGASDGRDDVLDLLIKARDPETGEDLSNAEIRDQSGTMLAAGFETTGRAMFWTLYLLALDQAEQAAVRAEIAADPPSRQVAEATRRWPRLRRAIFEAMRLYPPAPVLFRTALESDQLAGVDVPKGAMIVISPWIIHRHRGLWERPEAFIPSRFEGKAQEYLSGGAYLPFGAGPRICIGASFAMTEAAIVLAMMLERFEVGIDDPRPLMPISVVTTIPSIEPWFTLSPARTPAAA